MKVVCLKTPINSKGDPTISKVIHKLGLVALPVMSSSWADLCLQKKSPNFEFEASRLQVNSLG